MDWVSESMSKITQKNFILYLKADLSIVLFQNPKVMFWVLPDPSLIMMMTQTLVLRRKNMHGCNNNVLHESL